MIGMSRPASGRLHSPADQMAVALVVGMNGHGRVAQHGLGAGGRDDQVRRAVAQWVAQMPQTALFLLGGHLKVRQGGLEHRIPVHQSFAAVDQPLLGSSRTNTSVTALDSCGSMVNLSRCQSTDAPRRRIWWR